MTLKNALDLIAPSKQVNDARVSFRHRLLELSGAKFIATDGMIVLMPLIMNEVDRAFILKSDAIIKVGESLEQRLVTIGSFYPNLVCQFVVRGFKIP